jgi:hypothetical protein
MSNNWMLILAPLVGVVIIVLFGAFGTWGWMRCRSCSSWNTWRTFKFARGTKPGHYFEQVMITCSKCGHAERAIVAAEEEGVPVPGHPHEL